MAIGIFVVLMTSIASIAVIRRFNPDGSRKSY